MSSLARSVLFAAFLLVGPLAGGLAAKTLKLPATDSAASLNVPDSWKPDLTDDGFEAVSPDGSVYIAFDVADIGNYKDLIDETFDYFKKHKIKINESSRKDSKMTLNGMQVEDFSWDGRDKEGPTKVSVSLITVKPGKLLVVTYWASPAGDKKYSDAVLAILNSIKPM